MKHILFFGLLTLIIYSCQKPTVDKRVESTQSDSTALVMYVDLDTTQIKGKDTLIVQKYDYDNLKRIINTYYIDYNSGVPDGLFQTRFYYNGADTLPFKRIETYYDLSSGTVNNPGVGYYSYKDGKVLSDSVSFSNNPLFYLVRKYSYVNNKITETIADNSTPQNIEVHKFYQIKNNENTTLQTDSTFFNGALMGGSQTFSFSYDTKNNPFYNLPQPFIDRSTPYYSMETYSEEMVYEKNNPIEITSGFHLKYVYEYKPNGYPSVARVYDIDAPSQFWFKRIFIYTKL